MSSSTTRMPGPRALADVTADWGRSIFKSPWLWAPFVTIGFYVAVSQIPDTEILTGYIRSHWSVYAEIALGFLGLSIILRKAIDVVGEIRALKLVEIDAASLYGINDLGERANSLYLATESVPKRIRDTKLVNRIREACHYVAGRRSAAAVEDHLRYLADLAVDSHKSSFAPLWTVIWTAPVLGIIGTILQMVHALHSVDPENLDASIPAVMTGLAGSFDSTVVGFGISFGLLFGKLFIQQLENHILTQIERFGFSQLAPCFTLELAPDTTAPLAKAEADAAAHLLERTESMINWQTGLWQEALEDLRQRWLESAREQQSQFASALETGMTSSLASHSQQLEEARGEFLKAFRSVGLELTRVTAGLQQIGEEHQAAFQNDVSEIWQAMQAQMAQARGEHHDQMARSVALLQTAVRGWHDDLTKATAAMTAQLRELKQHGELLQKVAGQEEDLVRLQTTLTHNLQSVRAMEAFEESIHSLNAAVHLLTMRTKAHAA